MSLTCIVVEGCEKTSSSMRFKAHRLLKKGVDGRGVPEDALWKITGDCSPRVVRLFGGYDSLASLLERYSFTDEKGCSFSSRPSSTVKRNLQRNASQLGIRTSTSTVSLPNRTVKEHRTSHLPRMASQQEAAAALIVGIPQRLPESGNCWWSSVCFLLMRSSATRNAFLKHLSLSEGRDLSPLFQRCLQDPSVGERLHRTLYNRYGFGDKPNIDPTQEGQNGFTQLTNLLRKLKIPIRVHVWTGKEWAPVHNKDRASPPSPPVFVGLRVHRMQKRPPLTWKVGERTYKLQGFLSGSEFCGHQTCVSRGCSPSVWHHSDSDATRLKIGPVSFKIDKGENVWDQMDKLLPHSNWTDDSRFCDMAPSNRSPLKVSLSSLKAEGVPIPPSLVKKENKEQGLVNVDYLYVDDKLE